MLMDAWRNRGKVLADPSLYCRELEGFFSGGDIIGTVEMPLGLVIKCWKEGSPFILPDGRRIFSFSGSILSGVCTGWAVDLDTGEISPFRSKEGNEVTFQRLLYERKSRLKEQ